MAVALESPVQRRVSLYPPRLVEHITNLDSNATDATSPAISSTPNESAPNLSRDSSTGTSRQERPLPSIPSASPRPVDLPIDPSVSRVSQPLHRSTSSRKSPSTVMLPSSQRVRTRTLSSFLPLHTTPTLPSFLTFMSRTRPVSLLLSFLTWQDFLSLTQTCKGCRNIFHDERLRDVVLSRFVDGYGYCLRNADESLREGMRDVPITLLDLHLLLMSQTTPLHIYPTHALTVMSSLLPSVTQHSKSQQLVRLTQTHSRFALLLQSLAHSSSKPPLPEPEPEVFSPSLTLAETSPSAWRAHVSHLHPRPLSLADSSGGTASFRELNFPAPLSCSTPSSPRRSLDVLPDAADGHGRRSVSAHQKFASTGPRPDVKAHAAHPGGRHKPSDSSASSASSGATHLSGGSKRQSSHTPQSSASSTSGTIKKKFRRLSILGGSTSNATPPPPSEPKALKDYSTGWRRSIINASSHASSPHSRRASTTRALSARASSGLRGWLSDDESSFSTLTGREDFDYEFRRPDRKFATSGHSSSNSSFGSGSAVSVTGSGGSATPSTDASSRPPGDISPSMFYKSPLSNSPLSTRHSSWNLHPSLTSASPHDLILATSRVRAPILRVFVPCTELSESSGSAFNPDGPGSIQLCEEQLVESGLWEHLSVGDVVCNLGYVPPRAGGSNDDSEAEDEVDDLGRMRMMKGRGRRGRVNISEARKWLIFNGEILVPSCPPEDRWPIEDPLSLPSPWYYEHIMPSPPSALSSSPGHHRLASQISMSTLGDEALDRVHGKSGNPRIILDRIPPPAPGAGSEVPQMTLVNYATTVRSPHSRGGFAAVRKWVWIAKVWRGSSVGPHSLPNGGGVSNSTPSVDMGIGWEGEWILEGEGTKEGKQILLSCLSGVEGKKEWEFVREKSGGRKIWLKLLSLHPPESPHLPFSQNL